MVNEEDHLRIQYMLSGFRLHEVWDEINNLDDQLEEETGLCLQPFLGYLTACPTNVGTGIRVGVMLHLPGLVLQDQTNRQGFPRPPEDQPGRSRALWRRQSGFRRFLSNLEVGRHSRRASRS